MVYILLYMMVVPLLIKALRNKDWNICLLFCLYPILPNTFAIEISKSLPLLTAGRVLILLNFIIYLKRKRFKVFLTMPKFFKWYFGITLIIMILNLYQSVSAVSGIINIVLEQIILLIIIIDAIDSEDKLLKYLDYLIYGFTLSSIVGIIQTVLHVDIAIPLHIVTTRQEIGLNLRMGTMRACGFSTSAIGFACEITFLILLTIFMYERKKDAKYMLFMAVFIITLICTLSRSSWAAIALVLLLMAIIRFREFTIKYLKFLVALVPFVLLFGCVFPEKITVIIEPIKTMLNAIGTNFTVTNSFGDNSTNMLESRMFQWSAIQYMFREGKILLGYGYNAYQRGKIHFYYSGYSSWDVAQAIDVGFVFLVCERGILGLIAYMALLIGVFKKCVKFNEKKMNFFKIMIYIIVIFVTENILSSCVDDKVIIMLLGMFCAMLKMRNTKRVCKTI